MQSAMNTQIQYTLMTTVDITENFSLTQIGVKHDQVEVHDNTRAFGYDSVMNIVRNVGSKTMSCGTTSSSFSSFVSHFWFLPFFLSTFTQSVMNTDGIHMMTMVYITV